MSSIRVKLPFCALLFFLCLANGLSAQSTEADIKTRLQDKQLYLRGFWGDPQLHFNSDGSLSVPSNPLSFTVAGFRLKGVKMSKDKLTLKGKRMGLEFKKEGQKWVEVENLEIEIAIPASGDFTPPLDAIFTDDLASLVPSLPSYWQRLAQCKLFPTADTAKSPAFCQPAGKPETPTANVWGAVSAPRPEIHPDAQFNRFARKVKYSGRSVVGLIIDQTGQPGHLRVVTPIGLGLDEQALAAIQGWHFTPASQNGTPVKAEVNIEVNFHIY